MSRVGELLDWVSVSRFAVIGCVGFAVDGGIMLLLMKNGYGVASARLVSFGLAVTVTWALNRVWTFSGAKRGSKRREYLYYVVTQLAGAALNLGIFFVCVSLSPTLGTHPLIPLAIGAIGALLFNFAVSSRLVFRGRGS